MNVICFYCERDSQVHQKLVFLTYLHIAICNECVADMHRMVVEAQIIRMQRLESLAQYERLKDFAP